MDVIAHGWSAEDICRQYPHLTLGEVHAALAYYFDHKDEMDEEIRKEWEAVDKAKEAAPPSPFLLRMRAKGIL